MKIICEHDDKNMKRVFTIEVPERLPSDPFYEELAGWCNTVGLSMKDSEDLDNIITKYLKVSNSMGLE